VSVTAVPALNSWRIVATVAGVDGRRLIRHPLCIVGAGISLIGIVMFVRTTTSDHRITWDDDAWTVSAGFIMLAMFTMIATNLTALRDRREHTIEQHATLPVAATQRTGGLLAATLLPATVALVLLGAVTAYGATRVHLTAADRVHVVAQVVIVVMLGVFGVALAAWAPNPFVAPVAAWAVVFLTPSEPSHAWQVLAPLTGMRDAGLSAWHVAYQIGLTTLFATVALARTARRRTTLVGALAGLAMVIPSAIVLLARACPVTNRCLF
jgi:hypothetical protein